MMTDNKPFDHIVVAGAGAWGTALAVLLARAGRNVTLWSRNAEVVKCVAQTRENTIYLAGTPLPDGLAVTDDLSIMARADAILSVVPVQYQRNLFPHFRDAAGMRSIPVALCSKGIEQSSGKFVHDVLGEIWPEAIPSLLSGPSFAADVAAGLPTAVTLADKNGHSAAQWQASLSTQTFRPYLSDDLIGVAIGGAIKNVLAIACGVVEGCALGESAKAALMARGFAEILRFAVAKGARAETLHGLSGLGDMILTCGSRQSRNMSLGYEIGKGRSVAAIMAERHTVAEGAATAPILRDLARNAGVDMPIVDAVAALVAGEALVADTLAQLLARPLKREA